jgi:cell division protein FtsQ
MMLTPGVRGLIRVGVPLALIAVIGLSWSSHDANRELALSKWQEMKQTVQHRPEFMIASLDVTGTDDALTAQVLTSLPVVFPVSSFDLDLEAMRVTVETLPSVRSARVRLGDAGVLMVDVTQRVPVALWRDGNDLRLLDEEGTFAGLVSSRTDRLDLPLIAGAGATAHMEEALALFRNAKPIAGRLRGLVRMGDRRWDVVLDRDQRILLPAENPVAALGRVVVLHQARDLLDRDVATVDMRNANRPTLKMNKEAADAFRRVSQTEANE